MSDVQENISKNAEDSGPAIEQGTANKTTAVNGIPAVSAAAVGGVFIANAKPEQNDASTPKRKVKQYSYRVNKTTPDEISNFLSDSINETYTFPSLVTDLIMEHLILRQRGEVLFEPPKPSDEVPMASLASDTGSVFIQRLADIERSEAIGISREDIALLKQTVDDIATRVGTICSAITDMSTKITTSDDNQRRQFEALVNGIKEIEQAKLKKYTKRFDAIDAEIAALLTAGVHTDGTSDFTTSKQDEQTDEPASNTDDKQQAASDADKYKSQVMADASQYAEIKIPHVDEDNEAGEDGIASSDIDAVGDAPTTSDDEYDFSDFIDGDTLPEDADHGYDDYGDADEPDETDIADSIDDFDGADNIEEFGDVEWDIDINDSDTAETVGEAWFEASGSDKTDTRGLRNGDSQTLHEKLEASVPEIFPETPRDARSNIKRMDTGHNGENRSEAARNRDAGISDGRGIASNGSASNDVDIMSELLGA